MWADAVRVFSGPEEGQLVSGTHAVRAGFRVHFRACARYELATTDITEGSGPLSCFAGAFAVSVAAKVGQAHQVLDAALAAGIRECRNFLGICPGHGDDEYDYDFME